MSDDDFVERRTVRDTPDGREEVRETAPGARRSSTAGWWIAAVVAIMAAIGLVFLFSTQSSQDQVQAAREQGMAQASADAATADAKRAAAQADQAAQAALDSSARADRSAAQTAQVAARSAQSAADAGQNASATEPAQPQQ